MDVNPSVRHMFGNDSSFSQHCTQSGLDLPSTCQGLLESHFDIVIVNSVLDTYGAELIDQDEEESVRQLFAGISSASKSGATVIVGRFMSKLCCSMSIYEQSQLSPTKVADLPWRRSFIPGGHVFDTLRNNKRRDDDKNGQDSAPPPPHELSSRFSAEVDGIPQRAEIVVPMLPNVHERDQKRKQAARSFCDGLHGSMPCEQIINNMLATHIQMYVDLVEKRSHCQTHSLLFVAHPDDEALFFGAELVTHPSCWVVVSLTNGNNQWRKAEFEESMRRSGAVGLIWNYKDCSTCLPFVSTELSPILLEDQVRFLLDLRSDWSRIVTHGIAGEYGHPQHRALHNVIVNVCEDIGCLEKLWCVHPVAWHQDWVSRSHSHSQLERFSLLEAYGSQRDAIRKFINLETVVVPYHEHVRNISSLAVGCQHSLDDRSAAAFFRWFCNSWVGKN